jgi:uncharacterized membrane protein YfcA
MPYFLVLSAGMLMTAPVGVRLQSKVEVRWLKYGLAILISFTGLDALGHVFGLTWL